MKKVIFIFLLIVSASFLPATENIIPARPSNIPEDAVWNGYHWRYSIPNYSFPLVVWYKNGNLNRLYYETVDKQYIIDESYYENGKMEKRIQQIRLDNSNNKPCKSEYSSYIRYAGKQPRYYENGSLKDESCYTLVLKKSNSMVNVLCGSQVFYNETGKEIKRVDHKIICEYGCDEVPRQTAEQLMAMIKPYYDKKRFYQKVQRLEKLPVIGKIVSINRSSKEIEILYKEGFVLSIGDGVCCLVDNEKLTFECKKNKGGIGVYELKEDENNKFSLLNEDTSIRFFKKNEMKNLNFLKPKSKPKAGDVKIIGGIEFVYIPAAEITTMHEGKEYYYTIKAFWMQKYEMTLGEYLKFSYEKDFTPVHKNKTALTLNSTYPVIFERLEDSCIISYCCWFNSKYGVKSRLPRWPEWKYAAWAGTTTEYYPTYNKIGEYSWYKKNSGKKQHPVGQKKPNAFGLYDMIGNVWESLNSDDSGDSDDEIDSNIPSFITGGSSNSDESDLRYDFRITDFNYSYCEDKGLPPPNEDVTKQGVGFRLVISAIE